MFVTQLQMRALASAQVDRFARDMEVHCGRVFPRTHASLQGPELTAAVRSAIDRAISHGFNQQGSVRLYIELSFIFGHRFDIDPLTPWVAPILDRYAKDDPLSAAEALYSVSLEWIEQTHGPGNSHLLAALHTLRAVTQQRIGGSEGWRSDTLARVYPQKVEALGAAGMQRFLVEAQARIDPLGLASDEAGSVDDARIIHAVVPRCLPTSKRRPREFRRVSGRRRRQIRYNVISSPIANTGLNLALLTARTKHMPRASATGASALITAPSLPTE